MECYNCGAKLGKGDICQNCGANVKIYKKIIMASNAYYNDALEKAAVREARMCHPGARRLRRGRHRGRTVQGAVIRKEECVCGFSSRLDPRFSPV